MPVLFFLLAIVIFFFHWIFQRRKPKQTLELLLIYIVVFCLGFTGIASFIAHVFYPAETAELIGWPSGNPFQFEVGIADLAFGVLAILSFWLRRSFLFAAILGNTIWLWGDAVGHIRQMTLTGIFHPGAAGVYFWSDIFIPAIVILLYWFREKKIS